MSRLCALNHTLMRIADRVLLPVGLTASRLMLLKRAEAATDEPTISWLSEQLSLSVQAISRMVAALEEDGLVVRRTRAGAGRCVFVALTKNGRGALEDAASELAQVSEALRRDLNASDERLVEAMLDRMLGGLRDFEAQPESAEVRGR